MNTMIWWKKQHVIFTETMITALIIYVSVYAIYKIHYVHEVVWGLGWN